MAKTKKKKVRAFRVYHKVRFAKGVVVDRSPYYETSDAVVIDCLLRCKDQTAQEVELGSNGVPMRDPVSAATPADLGAPESPEPVETGEPQPDWSFKTIPAMRAWLDRCGVELPKTSRGKPKHEKLCADTWAEGLRPHPLYGFPGGIEPSPGQAGPKVTVETLSKAIEEAEAEDRGVPSATLEALAAMVAPETPAEAPQAAEEGAAPAAPAAE